MLFRSRAPVRSPQPRPAAATTRQLALAQPPRPRPARVAAVPRGRVERFARPPLPALPQRRPAATSTRTSTRAVTRAPTRVGFWACVASAPNRRAVDANILNPHSRLMFKHGYRDGGGTPRGLSTQRLRPSPASEHSNEHALDATFVGPLHVLGQPVGPENLVRHLDHDVVGFQQTVVQVAGVARQALQAARARR